MIWKESKVAKFRFDPKVGVATGDLQALNLRLQTQQKQILNFLEQRIREYESLAPTCRAEIEKLKPLLTRALDLREQAHADMTLMS